MRVQKQGSETWVCTRVQPEGGTELAGGKLVASEAAPVSHDSN